MASMTTLHVAQKLVRLKVACWPSASQNAFPWNVRWSSDSYQSHNWLHTKKRGFYNQCCRTFLPLVGTTTIKRHFGNKQPLRCSLCSAPRHAALSLRSGQTTPATRFGTQLVPHLHPDFLYSMDGRDVAQLNVIGHSPIYKKKHKEKGRALFYFNLIFFRNLIHRF